MSTKFQEAIDRLRELDLVTAPAPWDVTPYGPDKDTACWIVKDCEESTICSRISNHSPQANFEFIKESRNAIPLLLKEIERLTTENAKAWDDGYKHGQLSGIKTHRTGHVQPYKNPHKEDKK